MSWKKVKFGSLYKIDSRNGLTKPSKVRGEGYKMINMGELFSYDRIYDIPMELVPLTDSEKINAKVEVGDLLFARQSLVLEGAGKCSIIMETSDLTVFESHIIRVRLKSEENPLFYYYYFKSPLSPVSTIVSQCAQAGIRGSDLSNLEVICPSRDIQDKIVDILSAYDNLIENNQKQIKLLEEAAQRLYKEWFIDLRFPGYENVEIVDGVPEGWQYKKVSSFGSVITGKTPSTAKSQYYGGEVPFIKIPDMHKGIFPLVTEVTLSLEGAKSQKNKFIPKNSIMVSCIATVGLVNISIEDCQTNQQINSIVLADERSLYYLYFAMKDLKSLLDGVGSNGATMTNVNKEKFSNLSILCPNTLLLEKYYEYSKPLFDKILNLSKNINCLTEARDRLLPKLMSGEIEV
ncbi:restriction endonuclease subunit S [Veillonella rogosae JCM 15642]|uniref:Restriction endonuclease subunit S n=1 Tax=Veillonella rogosae JCM 15642 TaxID=1298595 RepID=A0ABX5BZ67_9FIRM|nr:restriction endonuclease subunit S [Veillonella rogosae]PQL14353.1 restriction endonuclease subunit S [Veillonella rogosae JCM 15642]